MRDGGRIGVNQERPTGEIQAGYLGAENFYRAGGSVQAPRTLPPVGGDVGIGGTCQIDKGMGSLYENSSAPARGPASLCGDVGGTRPALSPDDNARIDHDLISLKINCPPGSAAP